MSITPTLSVIEVDGVSNFFELSLKHGRKQTRRETLVARTSERCPQREKISPRCRSGSRRPSYTSGLPVTVALSGYVHAREFPLGPQAKAPRRRRGSQRSTPSGELSEKMERANDDVVVFCGLPRADDPLLPARNRIQTRRPPPVARRWCAWMALWTPRWRRRPRYRLGRRMQIFAVHRLRARSCRICPPPR